MTTPINTQPSPFTDPNNALREFNAYFGSLRKDYGEDAIRAMGFTPRDLAALQASLRKLQMDPTATPEQHRQAYMQARDMLAQKVTTPLASTRSYAQVQGLGQSSPQSVTASDGTVVEVARPNLPMATPTQEQLYEYARGVAKGQQSLWDPRIGKFVPAPTEAAAPKAAAPNPFADPNYALSQLNAYFGGLRKDYGENAIRATGFSPRDLAEMQASLRKLQMDPRATPEQHQQAYQQARDALAQKVTTPLTAARKPVEVEVRGVRPEMPTPPQIEVPMVGNGDFRPTAAQIADYNAGRVKGHWNSDRGVFEDTFVPPPTDTREVTGYRTPAPGVRGGDTRIFAAPVTPPVPSATDYIASIVTPPKPAELPMPPVGSPALLGDAPRPGITPMQPTAPGILPGITQQQPAAPSMNTQPGADFDRNVARQIFDSEFRTLREKYGDEGLRAAGFTPRTLSALQAPLTNVQKDNTISYDQSSAALENALKQLRGYNFGGAQPAAPMQPAAPAPLPAGAQQSPIPGYYRGGFAQRYR